MLEALAVFAVQLVYVFLLGAQSLNVNTGRYVGAFSTSLMLGVMGYWITSVIASYKQEAIGSPVWFAYVLGGPCGIVLAMVLHPRLTKLWKRRT